MIIGMEKSEKNLWKNCDADMENEDVYYTGDYPCIC